jgi:hypothetical protein
MRELGGIQERCWILDETRHAAGELSELLISVGACTTQLPRDGGPDVRRLRMPLEKADAHLPALLLGEVTAQRFVTVDHTVSTRPPAQATAR